MTAASFPPVGYRKCHRHNKKYGKQLLIISRQSRKYVEIHMAWEFIQDLMVTFANNNQTLYFERNYSEKITYSFV